jgi:hypothetical protein
MTLAATIRRNVTTLIAAGLYTAEDARGDLDLLGDSMDDDTRDLVARHAVEAGAPEPTRTYRDEAPALAEFAPSTFDAGL